MSRFLYQGITQQRKAALKRLRDAEFLLAVQETEAWRRSKGPHARGAMYLAGYAVECKLKAIALEVHRCLTLSQLIDALGMSEHDVYTHGLDSIAKRLPQWSSIRRGAIWPDFKKVNVWRPAWRYDPEDHSNESALKFFRAVQKVYDWLEKSI